MRRLGKQSSILRIDFFLVSALIVESQNLTVCKCLSCLHLFSFFFFNKTYSCTQCYLNCIWKRSGVNQWRDQLKPSQILQNLARMRGIPAPQISDDGSFLAFGGREYRLDELGMFIELLDLDLNIMCMSSKFLILNT